MRISDINELAAYAAGACALDDLSKSALIELHRHLFGSVGDTGRTPKEAYAAKIEAEGADMARLAAGELAQTVPAVSTPAAQPAQAAPAAAGGDAAALLAQAVQMIAQATTPKAAPLDESRVLELIKQHARPQVQRIVVTEQGEHPAPAGAHPLFEKCVRLVSAGLNVLLVGPAGAGKTHLARAVADSLGLQFGAVSCTAGMSESQLLGWLLPTGEHGRFEYNPAQFISLTESGNSLFLFDELDAADPNLLLIANTAFSNDGLHVPQRVAAPFVKKGERAFYMATANTYGSGADMQYAGRNQLDAATLDRFYVLDVAYNRSLEAAIMGVDSDPPPAWEPASTEPATIADDLTRLCGWLFDVRQRATDAKLRRVVSTRAFQKAAAARRAGVPVAEIKRDLLAGWTRDELAKVGEQ